MWKRHQSQTNFFPAAVTANILFRWFRLCLVTFTFQAPSLSAHHFCLYHPVSICSIFYPIGCNYRHHISNRKSNIVKSTSEKTSRTRLLLRSLMVNTARVITITVKPDALHFQWRCEQPAWQEGVLKPLAGVKDSSRGSEEWMPYASLGLEVRLDGGRTVNTEEKL